MCIRDSSSTSYEVHGRQTTEHTIRHYRTYIDGHYAQLVSSLSKVYSDPPIVSATPVYDPQGAFSPSNARGGDNPNINANHQEFTFPREHIKPSKPTGEDGVIPTRTIGSRYKNVKSPKALKLEQLLKDESKKSYGEDEPNENAIRARSIDCLLYTSPSPRDS